MEDVSLLEFRYLVFTRMPGESYRKRLGSFSVVVLVLHISSADSLEDVSLLEFMYLVFTRMPGESYRKRLGSFNVVELVLHISSAN